MDAVVDALRKESDLILFDSPPALAVADASILAGKVDGAILVVDTGTTRALALQRAAEALARVPGVSLRFTAPFFKEFVLQLPVSPERVVKRLQKDRILAGLPLKPYDRSLKDCLLVAVTEKRTREEIDAYADALARAVR
jgi:glycine cleavage system pyridoxal-binding protein P